MPAFTDIALLSGLLREAPETLVDEKEQGDISPYLLETILPMLVNGNYPRLRDIDFEQFELYDPPELVGYMEKRDRRESQLKQLNQKLCDTVPVCVGERAFL